MERETYKMKKENSYIMNLEAMYLYKDSINNIKTTSKKRDLAKLFSATIPFSLETSRINKMFEDSFYSVNGKQYTKKIINLTFDKNYDTFIDTDEDIIDSKTGEVRKKKKKKTLANKKKIRKHLYLNGFTLDGVKYVFYKRGAGKAKVGYALYIQENMRDKLISRSRLGLIFEDGEEVDLTSLLAYESLITSGLEFTIDLDPKTEVMIMDDIYGIKFKSKASVTREVDGELVTKNELIELQNCLTDGQGLMDESVFEKYDKSDKGFMLLRNDMFKCCAFNTKLQDWFKYNEVTELVDMFGTVYDASKVKLITTPNSFKFLKFKHKIGNGTEKECFDYYVNNIDSEFGVVKCDKEGNYGDYNRTTYQLLNSIPNLTYDDLREITREEREYVELLKNDIAVFRHYLGCDVHASLELEENMENNKMEMYATADVMNMLMLVNSDIQYTKKFRDIRKKLIFNYVSHLRGGNIRMEGNKYMTLFSNPYEMLLATIGKYEGNSIMKGREVYSSNYRNNQEFCITRNPHINAGNVMWGKNNKRNEYKWFNITNNIGIVNSYDSDLPDRLQGCDFDSDTAEFIKNEILVEKAKYCEDNFTTPINRVRGSSVPRKYNMMELYKLDVTLSDNYIGKIINLSQICNSYMNDLIQKNGDKKMIEMLYHASSRLSSMSQIEIDKSKKVFDNVNMRKEISNIKKLPCIRYEEEMGDRGDIVSKMVCPNFFGMISDSNSYRKLEKFETPLDILQDVLNVKKAKRIKSEKIVSFDELLLKPSKLKGHHSSGSVASIYKDIECCGKKINSLRIESCTLSEESKRIVSRFSKMDAKQKIKEKSLNERNTYTILKYAFGKKENDKIGFKKYAMLTLNLLNSSKQYEVLRCFKSKNMSEDKVIIKSTIGDLIIFGDTYDKIEMRDLKTYK